MPACRLSRNGDIIRISAKRANVVSQPLLEVEDEKKVASFIEKGWEEEGYACEEQGTTVKY